MGFLVITALLYGGFRAYPLLTGPSVTVYSPHDGDIVASSTFQISGIALRARELTLQGKPITVDTAGYFSEILIPQKPYTVIVITATDDYGAHITKTLNVIPEE